jgi:hypothetical protein
MTHLTTDQLLKTLDGAFDARGREHLDSCAACQRSVAELRGVVQTVRAAGDVPEPSPLFWTHFSARVREATAGETPAPPFWSAARWRAVALVAAAAGLALVVAVIARPGPSKSAAGRPEASAITVAMDTPDPVEDVSIDTVAAAVGNLSWDEAREANLMPRAGAVDAAVAGLTDAQQKELIRLLRQMGSGAE